MLPLSHVIRKHNLNYHNYADDSQLYISLHPDDLSPISSLTQCIKDINQWMSDNFLQLNKDKTEILLFGAQAHRQKNAAHLSSLSLDSKTEARNLGVIIDSNLNFRSHINHITKTSFYHLKNISKLRGFLSKSDSEKLIHAFITSRLDYCNSLFTGIPKSSIQRFQLIQNAAARILTGTKKHQHITPVLKSLHWLPVRTRIDFKILLLVYKALHGLAPRYITDMLTTYTPARTLRATGSGNLLIPHTRSKEGEAAFSVYAPQKWNTLPDTVRHATSVTIFKNRLKTHLFSTAFC